MKIKLENIYFSYPFSNGLPILHNIRFDISENEFIGIVGPSGAGKTTLLELIKGLIQPTQGTVLYNNIPRNGNKKLTRDISQKIGLLYQFPEKQLFEDTVYDDISFAPRNFGYNLADIESAVKESLSFVNLDFSAIADKSPYNLSGGEKRRIALAGVLAMNPEILMLDEPTTGIDYYGIAEIEKTLDKLYNEGRTIIIASHDMDFIFKNVKRIIGLKNGKINFDGQKLDFFNNESLINDLKLEIPSVINWLQQKGYAQKNNFIVNKEIEEIFQNINMR